MGLHCLLQGKLYLFYENCILFKSLFNFQSLLLRNYDFQTFDVGTLFYFPSYYIYISHTFPPLLFWQHLHDGKIALASKFVCINQGPDSLHDGTQARLITKTDLYQYNETDTAVKYRDTFCRQMNFSAQAQCIYCGVHGMYIYIYIYSIYVFGQSYTWLIFLIVILEDRG
jgi:hypothetical protein